MWSLNMVICCAMHSQLCRGPRERNDLRVVRDREVVLAAVASSCWAVRYVAWCVKRMKAF